MITDKEPHDFGALLRVVHEAAAQVGHSSLAARAGDTTRAQAHNTNALRALNLVTDELRFGPEV